MDAAYQSNQQSKGYSVGISQGMNTACAADPKQSEVDGQVCLLEENIEHIHMLISEMEKRLGNVLVSSPEGKAENKPETVLVPLAARLRESGRKSTGACIRLQSILSRLEV